MEQLKLVHTATDDPDCYGTRQQSAASTVWTVKRSGTAHRCPLTMQTHGEAVVRHACPPCSESWKLHVAPEELVMSKAAVLPGRKS